MDRAAFSEPVEVKILERRPNGSGVVEIPLLPVTEIDGKLTAGGGGKIQITREVLKEIVANFASFPGPVPIGVSPHDGDGDRGGFSKGFVNAVMVRGDMLYGQLDLIPALFAEVDAGGWRGFSVELARNLKTATVELAGWALTGGIFTNRPATDVNFRIAASSAATSEQAMSFSIRLTAGEEETDMSEERIAVLEAELASEKELVKALRAKDDTTKVDTAGLETRLQEKNKDLATANMKLSEVQAKFSAAENELARINRELAKQEAARREAEVKLEAEEQRALAEAVTKLAQDAIDRGVSAKLFEGLEADPAAWFNARYASIGSFKEFVDALPTIKESAVQSGNKPDGNAVKISEENAARLERMGLDPKYAGVTNENDFIALRSASKE